MSGGTALAALPHYSDIVDLVTDDPFLVDIIAPIESEALAAAIDAAQLAADLVARTIVDAVVTEAVAQAVASLEEQLRTRLRVDVEQVLDAVQRQRARANLGLGEVSTMSAADVIAAVRGALEGKEF